MAGQLGGGQAATALRPSRRQPLAARFGRRGRDAGALPRRRCLAGARCARRPRPPAQPIRVPAAQRRRRMWLIGGLVAGTARRGRDHRGRRHQPGRLVGPATADQAVPRRPHRKAPTPPRRPHGDPTASASATSTPPASVLSDGQSGLSYSQLATPWRPVCPGDLDSAFSWTAGNRACRVDQRRADHLVRRGVLGPAPRAVQLLRSAGPGEHRDQRAQTLENAYYNNAQPHHPAGAEPADHGQRPPGLGDRVPGHLHQRGRPGRRLDHRGGRGRGADTGTGNTPVAFFTSVPDNARADQRGLAASPRSSSPWCRTRRRLPHGRRGRIAGPAAVGPLGPLGVDREA